MALKRFLRQGLALKIPRSDPNIHIRFFHDIFLQEHKTKAYNLLLNPCDKPKSLLASFPLTKQFECLNNRSLSRKPDNKLFHKPHILKCLINLRSQEMNLLHFATQPSYRLKCCHLVLWSVLVYLL